MKKLRFLIAAALAAGSMAVSAGAVGFTADDAAVQSAIAQLQKQWQADPDQDYIFLDGDNYHASARQQIASENIYELYFSIDFSRSHYGVINLKTGEIIIPPQYDRVDFLTNDKILLTRYDRTQPHTSEFYLADETGTVTPLNLPVQGSYIYNAGDGCFFVSVYEKRPLLDYIYYEQPTVLEYDIP